MRGITRWEHGRDGRQWGKEEGCNRSADYGDGRASEARSPGVGVTLWPDLDHLNQNPSHCPKPVALLAHWHAIHEELAAEARAATITGSAHGP